MSTPTTPTDSDQDQDDSSFDRSIRNTQIPEKATSESSHEKPPKRPLPTRNSYHTLYEELERIECTSPAAEMVDLILPDFTNAGRFTGDIPASR